MAAFGVIVCTKCREHAQIIELAGAKKTSCQKCGSILEVRKQRLFFESDDLGRAVSARTFLQAKLHGQENELETVFSEMSESAVKVSSSESGDFGISQKPFTDNRKPVRQKRDRKSIILEILQSNNGKMDAESLKELAEGHGVEGQMFEKILEKLIMTGEVYEPSKGKVCLT